MAASLKDLQEGLFDAQVAKKQAPPEEQADWDAEITKLQGAIDAATPKAVAGKPSISIPETIGRAIPGSSAVTDPEGFFRYLPPEFGGYMQAGEQETPQQKAHRIAATTANEQRNAAAAGAHPTVHAVTRMASAVPLFLAGGALPTAGRMLAGGLIGGALDAQDRASQGQGAQEILQSLPLSVGFSALGGALPVGPGLSNIAKGAAGGTGLAVGEHEARSLQQTGELSRPEPKSILLGAALGAAAPAMATARAGIRNPVTQTGRNIEAIESQGGKLNVIASHDPGSLPPISVSPESVGSIPGAPGKRLEVAASSNEAFGESNNQLVKTTIHQADQINRALQKRLAMTENVAVSRYPSRHNEATGIVDGIDGLIAEMSIGDPASPFNAEGNRLKAIRDKLVTKHTMEDGSVQEVPKMLTLKEEVALRRQLDHDAKVGAPTGKGGTGIGNHALKKAAAIVRADLAENAPPELRQAFADRHQEMTMAEDINDRLMGMDDPTIDWNAPRETRLASRFGKYGAEIKNPDASARDMQGQENTATALRDLDALYKKAFRHREPQATQELGMSRAHRALNEMDTFGDPNVRIGAGGPHTSWSPKGIWNNLKGRIDPALENITPIEPFPLLFGADNKRREKRP